MRFSLRFLLVVITLCALACVAWRNNVQALRAQQAAAAHLRQFARSVEMRPARPAWVRRIAIWLGQEDLFRDIVAMHMEGALQLRDDDLRVLADLPRLERLYLGGTRIGDAGLQHVRHLRHLRRISLWYTSITDEGLAHFAGLTELEAVDIHATRITERSLEYLTRSPQLKGLRFDCELSDRGLATLVQLPQAAQTRLRCCGVTREPFLAALRSPAVSTLSHLHLKSVTVDEPMLRGMAEMRLRELECISCRLPVGVLEAVDRMPSLGYVSLLDTSVRFDDLADRFGPRVGGLTDSPSGITLRLADRNLWFSLRADVTIERDSGMAYLARLPNLKSLSIARTIDDEALRCCSELPRLTMLRLFTTQPRVTAEGFRHLGRLTQLEHLNLMRQSWPDECFEFLRGLAKLRSADFVELRNFGARGLAAVLALPQLKEVRLTHTQVTNADLTSVRTQRKDVRITCAP